MKQTFEQYKATAFQLTLLGPMLENINDKFALSNLNINSKNLNFRDEFKNASENALILN